MSDGGGSVSVPVVRRGVRQRAQRKLYEKFWVFINGFILIWKNANVLGFKREKKRGICWQTKVFEGGNIHHPLHGPALPSAAPELPTSFTTGRR